MAKKSKVTHNMLEYNKRYKRENMMSIAFRLSRISDAHLIEIYKSIPNKMEWFRNALREYGGE
ncbi:MAG: hypothetical protein IJJ44_12605 [Solobacterium sp.]|nr:hypothetical protein [Solobacterium sp.]